MTGSPRLSIVEASPVSIDHNIVGCAVMALRFAMRNGSTLNSSPISLAKRGRQQALEDLTATDRRAIGHHHLAIDITDEGRRPVAFVAERGLRLQLLTPGQTVVVVERFHATNAAGCHRARPELCR